MNHWKTAAAFALLVCAAGQAEAQERQRPNQRPERGPGMERLLQRFDANKDGKLDDAERAQARKTLGHKPAPGGRRGAPPNRKELVQRFDTNKDGKLDDAERARARQALGHRPQSKPGAGRPQGQGKSPPPNPKDFLQRFDTNKDGKLDDAEKQRARDLMRRVKAKVDVNGDGVIGPRERTRGRTRGREQIRRRRGVTPPPKDSIRRERGSTPPPKRQIRRRG